MGKVLTNDKQKVKTQLHILSGIAATFFLRKKQNCKGLVKDDQNIQNINLIPSLQYG